jgi:hypothetical protein
MKAALSITIVAGVLAAGLAGVAAPAAAQERIRQVVIYGKDPCPRGAGGEEIVICARKPETERYRVPKELRDAPSTDPASTSWANRAESLQYVGRTGIQSCSTVGPGGFTGCLAQMLAAARAERRQAAADAARVP